MQGLSTYLQLRTCTSRSISTCWDNRRRYQQLPSSPRGHDRIETGSSGCLNHSCLFFHAHILFQLLKPILVHSMWMVKVHEHKLMTISGLYGWGIGDLGEHWSYHGGWGLRVYFSGCGHLQPCGPFSLFKCHHQSVLILPSFRIWGYVEHIWFVN